MTVLSCSLPSFDLFEALAALVQAITLTRGEEGIMQVLEEAKAEREYERKSMVDAMAQARQMSRRLVNEETILSERGEQIILRDAFEDGSSVVCSRCGSLVPTVRAEKHSLYWCEFASNSLEDEEDD
jgi:RNA polymerase-binding transcription factor DksA